MNSLYRPPADLAFVCHGSKVFYAHELPAPHAPQSSVLRLIRGVYDRYPGSARSILRGRIFTTGTAGPLCRETVKVTAKRLTDQVPPGEAARAEGTEWIELIPEALPTSSPPAVPRPTASHAEWMDLALEVAARVPRELPRYLCDRPVASLLVSKEGELLSWATNAASRNKTLHAEMLMLSHHFARTRGPVPREARIYTTLKPCRMCAGAIWHCAQDVATLEVYYAEFDPGPLGRLTVLDAGSPARRRFATTAELRACRVQAQLADGLFVR